jgi:hypothetical protein
MANRSPTAEAAPYLTGPAYAVALLFALFPFIDTLAQVWPLGLDSPSWRYGAIGLGANYTISVLFGVLGLALVAALRQHRRVLLAVTVVSGVGALLALVAALGFLLDAFQVRSGVPRDDPRTLWLFDVGAAKATAKYLLSAGVLAWLALTGWKAGHAIAAPELEHEAATSRLVSKQQK